MAAPAAVIAVPAAYPAVLSVASASLLMNIFQVLKVSAARKRAGIKYPALYADAKDAETRLEAKVFNCTQRAHQNTLEQAPYFLTGLLIAGLKHPRFATVSGALWLAGRVVYTLVSCQALAACVLLPSCLDMPDSLLMLTADSPGA